ncbi:MAG: hypothetical protein KDB05_32875, partial [Planctomycetales bacterium]|nr:hypothetical protein [Planctomycetales bacterium]
MNGYVGRFNLLDELVFTGSGPWFKRANDWIESCAIDSSDQIGEAAFGTAEFQFGNHKGNTNRLYHLALGGEGMGRAIPHSEDTTYTRIVTGAP